MSITEELSRVHYSVQLEKIEQNANPKTRNKAELMIGMRHGIAGWALTEATDEQILEIVKRNKKSPLN